MNHSYRAIYLQIIYNYELAIRSYSRDQKTFLRKENYAVVLDKYAILSIGT